jgi:hypothetical protein
MAMTTPDIPGFLDLARTEPLGSMYTCSFSANPPNVQTGAKGRGARPQGREPDAWRSSTRFSS